MMKKMKILVFVLLAAAFAAGTASYADADDAQYGRFGYGRGCAGGAAGYGMVQGYGAGQGYGMGPGYMMGYGYNGQWGQSTTFDAEDLKSIDALTENVEAYLDNFDGNFEVREMIAFSNTSYYVAVLDADTGAGAMELLVNPVTGVVYPEHGPGMMWNTEYDMHGFLDDDDTYFHRGMGSYYFASDYDEEDAIAETAALEKANAYLETANTGWEAEEGAYAFPGYYTFHVREDGEVIGLISVFAYTGDVWYHNWNGTLQEIHEID